MRRLHLPLALAVALLLPATEALAVVSVKLLTGETITAKTLDKMTSTELTVTKLNNEQVAIPVNTLESVQYEGEPLQLRNVRSAINNNNFEAAKQLLENPALDPSMVAGLEAQQEIQYFRALSAARLARTTQEIKDAGRAMFDFVSKNPSNWHYFEALEVLGDLFVADNQADLAVQQYTKLEAAPWPDFQMRGSIARGRALQSQNKHTEALSAYEKALQVAANQQGDAVESQKLAATVGKASCLAETGKANEGISLVQGVIAGANIENAELHAAAFTALGNCYLKTSPPQPKDAFMNFLKVDVLYPSFPKYHAEALYNLSKLWRVMEKPELGLQAKDELARRYSSSPWASKE